jgi:serine O-acetyltransferase
MISILKEIQYLLKRYKNFDPAANSTLEILFLYPGIKAVVLHRLAHYFWVKRVPFIPRFICEISKILTTIEIHPGAQVGCGLIIDHGLGVLIGQTSIIGDDVTLMPRVALVAREFKGSKRHPTIGNRVFIGTGATVVGNINIGDDAKIGANAVVLENVPANCTAVGIPASIVKTHKSLVLDREAA